MTITMTTTMDNDNNNDHNKVVVCALHLSYNVSDPYSGFGVDCY